VLLSDRHPLGVGADRHLSSGDSQSPTARIERIGVPAWFIIAAGVLLLAAFAKLQWILNNPLWEDIAIGGVWVTLAAIVFEAWAAACLLLISNRRHAAYIGLAFYVILLVASTGFLLTGQSCQCFGDWQLASFKIPTWSLPAYNLFAVLLFLFVAKTCSPITRHRPWVRLPDIGTQFGVALGLLLGLFMLSTAQGQQFYLAGSAANEVVLQVAEVPELVPGQSYQTTVTLHN